jgi:glycopeptide antibiotics resistance protein
MTATSREISGAPAGVALAVVGLVLVVWWLRRERALTVPRALAGAALCVYAAGVLANTAFPIFLGTTHADVPWTVYLNLVPLRDTETRDMLQNVAIFVPLGLLLPLVLPLRSALAVTAAAAALSLSIEGLQLLNAVTGHGGHIADVNDLLANVLGAPLGYALARAAYEVPIIRRIARAFAWPGSGTDHALA